jgi:hypothetical protein
MTRGRKNRQALASGLAGLLVALLALACTASRGRALPVQASRQSTSLEAEVMRLSARIGALENQLLQDRRALTRAQQETQEQRERVAALESQVPASRGESSQLSSSTPATVGTTQVEEELRVAFRALSRAIERLDISAEEKAALKSSLKPTRQLDHDNPWSLAKH